ncbi:class I SAM-dependent methyltransferase [Halomonas elongata]|uniref:class I SAM-dependent methyltransferase n=1 Tax=Halomonas elongata TaxID=2746 RepID=UPI0023B0FDFE|nr:class I SAM-dependent methyltransferase [Halomonas elongata]
MTNGGRGVESRNGGVQAGTSRDAERLARHYAGAGGTEDGNRKTLVGRLRRAFVASGRNPDRLSLDDIAGIDQLHLGGRRASRSLARLGALSPGDRVLDVGCGTGGASRLLAEEHGVEVVGIDITAPFVEVAGWLSRATGLSSRTRFGCADAAATPLSDACVDVVWCQHALMNMPDMEAVLAEWHRLLAPGGRVLLHEVVAGDNPAALTLPVPWARERATSHLQTRWCLEQRLETAGFQPVDVTDVTAEALAWRRKHGRQESDHQSSAALPGPADLFGDIFSEMGRNLLDNLADDRVRIIEGAWVTT